MINEIKREFDEQIALVAAMRDQLPPLIKQVVDELAESFRSGGKLLVMGNGGSAADSQHFAAEIVGRFRIERGALPAIALSTDTSILTAIGNDYGFESVFKRQVEALADARDIVFGISTSGNSPNVLNALQAAKERGCRTIALLGNSGGKIKNICDISLIIPSDKTPRIQEAHIRIIHIICGLLENELFAKGSER